MAYPSSSPTPPSGPPPPQVGAAVSAFASYEEAVGGFRTALVDLEQSPSYLMLTGDELGRVTATKVGSAATDADHLWPLVHALTAALDEIRSATGMGVGKPNRAELSRLLTRFWLPDPAEPTGRDLTLGELTGLFRTRYDRVRSWVTEIDQLWLAVLPRVDAARASLARLRVEADELGITEPLIGRCSDLQADLEARLVTDPLSVSVDDGARLDALVTETVQQLASMRSGFDRLDEDLASTEVVLAELRVLRARAAAVASESLAKVVDPEGLVRVPSVAVLDGADGLAARLDGVFAQLDGLSWSQRRALIDGWLTMAHRLGDQLARAEECNRRPLERRSELRGRLTAYLAKMSAVGRAEDLELTAIADRARTQLYTAPSDLAAAATTTEELARMLRT